MGDDAVQAEKFQARDNPGPDALLRQEKASNASLVPSSTPSPSLNCVTTDESIRESSQVNAVTVLTLLDKLVNMLDTVQENQHKMEQRQINLEGSVKGIQNDLTKLSKYQTSTSNTVSKLLEKSRKVSAHTREVKERMERQCAQVKRLESNHAQLLKRNHFKVLIFQEENEIPTSVFAKEPVPSITEGKEESVDENKSLEETLHTVNLSSDDEIPNEEDALEDSTEEKVEESRAEKIKRSSLKKVDSLKKAFSRQNIEKKMNKLGTKIVSMERREKIKKSFTTNHQKTSSGKSSPFKVSPLTFGRKKDHEGEGPAEEETKRVETPASEKALTENEESSFTEAPSDASFPTAQVEENTAKDVQEKPVTRESNPATKNIELSIVEDEEFEMAQEYSQKNHDDRYRLTIGETEQSDEEQAQPAVLQIDQTA
ncbi:caveolae-associated protein 2 [Phascolarctos cinereus]|uniref:Serum deprivation-response protein n=1 Tax=Phascolarctos cinereus TaxID=38626 RepID=A0A6P5KXB4_PHACI|nr:serum deprivation-response protein [Phascolarctos cinereus]